jgi:hypothetical protein
MAIGKGGTLGIAPRVLRSGKGHTVELVPEVRVLKSGECIDCTECEEDCELIEEIEIEELEEIEI